MVEVNFVAVDTSLRMAQNRNGWKFKHNQVLAMGARLGARASGL